jgi:flavorubredoxin
MKLETVGGGVGVKYRPSPEEMQQCYEFGREFARRVRDFHKKYE